MGQGSASGVYYRREDYLGVAKRLLIDVVDFPVAVALSMLVLRAAAAVVPDLEDVPGAVPLLAGAPWFAYFVLLKRSRFRTLGYVVAGAQIVDLQGTRPGIFQLFGRLLFALAGPLNFVFDLLWLTGDGDRQAFRDKFASTYVVRGNATPAGTGTIVLRTYMFWGMTFLFKEVVRGAARTTAPAAPQEKAPH
jgi:uncharacterized RDD family membrane protein YckC